MQTLHDFVHFSSAVCTIPYTFMYPSGAGPGQSFPLERGCSGACLQLQSHELQTGPSESPRAAVCSLWTHECPNSFLSPYSFSNESYFCFEVVQLQLPAAGPYT